MLGDAPDVHYEFRMKDDISSLEQIETTPPKGFQRAHKGTEPGTWSDDGAQALCPLDSLPEIGRLDLTDFSDKLLRWYENGGTRAYTALTYKVVKWNRLIDENIRYSDTSVYWLPDIFKSIDELWVIEQVDRGLTYHHKTTGNAPDRL